MFHPKIEDHRKNGKTRKNDENLKYLSRDGNFRAL